MPQFSRQPLNARTSVDDFYGLDRVDRWLNSRQGIQRSVLNWSMLFYPLFLVGMVTWLGWELFATPSLIAVPVIALAAAVLAVPLRRLAPAWHARNSRRRPSRTGPEFSWRWIAFGILITTEMVLAAVTESIGQNLSHGLRATLSSLQVIVSFAMLPLLFTAYGYTRRYTQARLSHPSLPYPPERPDLHLPA